MSSFGVVAALICLVMLLQPVYLCGEQNYSTEQYLQGDSCNRTKRIASMLVSFINNTAAVSNAAAGLMSSEYMMVLLPLLYLIIFIVGLPANMLAFWVLIRKNKIISSTIFLISLTVADTLLILMLPFKIAYHFSGNNWIFGEHMCRLVTASFYGNMYASILCLMCISIDRYIAVVHPFAAKVFRSQKMACYGCLVLWVAVIGSMIPFCMITQTHSIANINITTCHDALSSDDQAFLLPYVITIFVVGFTLPSCVTLFCYGSVLRTLIKNKKKYLFAVKITALVLVMFIVCFAPSNIILVFHYSYESEHEKKDHLYYIHMLSLPVSSFNSCLDPFIYYYLSDEFRSKVRSVLKCKKKSYNISDQNTSSSSQPKSKGTIVSALDSCRQ
ncbi:proteinase-activated receptor 3-like [Polypterus senegalus]|uniref:proteinase-activated receptor 3-like n=1 Tax=Polypterus senegalus TaxID=55291 RepID=UPI0019646D25|nr:proteinase-activated receptor 3-like [Polypterus senegalus]